MRTIKNDKATEEGMQLLIDTVRRLVAKEIPIKRAEVFDKVFYLPTVWRKGDESMQKFIIRRHKEFAELREVSASRLTSCFGSRASPGRREPRSSLAPAIAST